MAEQRAVMEQLCRSKIGLSSADIERLGQIQATLQYTADLVGADVFLNCFYQGGSRAMVVAEAKPEGSYSLYDRSVVGEDADIVNEPAVFAVRSTGLPVRDLRATTQENKVVRQDVTPIKNDSGEVYAVLIREKDVSEQLRNDRKFNELARLVEKLNLEIQRYRTEEAPRPQDSMVTKEIHHRIKNNLQMVASILNMQARRSPTPEIKMVFKQNVSRVQSFAAIHDILTRNGLEEELSLLQIIEKVRRNTVAYASHEEQQIDIQVKGNDFYVSSDKATSIALVVNELLINALEHAFHNRKDGTITIQVCRGSQYSSITVSDNGTGFDKEIRENNSLGLAIVEMTISDRLNGKMHIFSDESGSKIRFDFKN